MTKRQMLLALDHQQNHHWRGVMYSIRNNYFPSEADLPTIDEDCYTTLFDDNYPTIVKEKMCRAPFVIYHPKNFDFNSLKDKTLVIDEYDGDIPENSIRLKNIFVDKRNGLACEGLPELLILLTKETLTNEHLVKSFAVEVGKAAA